MKYFLHFLNVKKEVTKQDWVKCEYACGFRSKFRHGHPATSGFQTKDANGFIIEGTIEQSLKNKIKKGAKNV